MIDPDNVTNFHQSVEELEHFSLWWILVAGKTAHSITPRFQRILDTHVGVSPFDKIRRIGKKLPGVFLRHGIGCFNMKADYCLALANSGLDLCTCSLEELRKIPGMGPKTARCFLIHSRPNQELAGLDRHILRGLREIYGYHDAPMSSPTNEKAYRHWEEVVISLYKSEGLTSAEFDLRGWKMFRRPKNKD